MLFDSGASHSFIAASCVRVLGLEVETLDEPLHVSSPIRTMARIDRICRGCELEISGILLMVEGHGHVRVRGHPRDGLVDYTFGCHRL